MQYVKEGWPHTMDSKDVLHYKKLEDFLITENGHLLLEQGSSKQADSGTRYCSSYAWALRYAADEATGPLDGTLAAHQ